MKILYLLGICFALFSISTFELADYRAITYELAGGRLGDQLIGYSHTKWVSHVYKIPFFYKPFPYSDQLILHDKEMPYNQIPNNMIPLTLKVGQSLENLIASEAPNTLYVIPYFPESLEEHLPTSGPAGYQWSRVNNYFPYFKVNWNDIEFKKSIQHLIAPKYPLTLINPPKDKISIAIQVRKNSGGYDLPFLHGLPDTKFDPTQTYVDVVFPLKHPPENYYLNQLKKVIEMFPQEKFYVFIFTDDPEPSTIVKNFQGIFTSVDIEFAHRTTSNNHYSNVLEDLFSMLNFDCLIRPDSNLTIIASKLGNFKLIISPARHYWEGRNLVIDQVLIEKFENGKNIAIKTIEEGD